LSADYSQIELVVLAHLSGDRALSTAFREGKDVHSQTGSLIFGVPDAEVTPEQRRIAKTINFGVMYGMSAFRLSRELKIPRALADEFIAAYFMKYSAIRQFIDATTEEAKKNGYVRTLIGRIRPIPGIDSRNRTEQQAAQRIAVNTPIQGTAADIVKKAMLAVRARLDRERLESRLILQVHDELVFEVPETEISVMSKLVREEMERAVTLKVPLRVSVETGGSWGALH
jgi:DNA polymerase-1